MREYYKRVWFVLWKDFTKSTGAQVVGALLAAAILALQIHYGVIINADIRANAWAIAWPYIALVIGLFVIHMVRAPWKLDGELRGSYLELKKRSSPNLSLSNSGFTIQPSPTGGAGPCIYIQLLPKCASQAPVQDCRGHLVRIEKWADGKWEKIYGESLKLEWSVYGGHLANLDPQAEYRLNLLWCLSTDSGFHLATSTMPLLLQSAFNQQDVFLLSLKIDAKDCEPLELYMQAQWGKKWDAPLLKMTQNAPVHPDIA